MKKIATGDSNRFEHDYIFAGVSKCQSGAMGVS